MQTLRYNPKQLRFIIQSLNFIVDSQARVGVALNRLIKKLDMI